MAINTRPPLWFWIVAIGIVLWGGMGVFAFYSDVTMDAASVAQLSEYDRAFRARQPQWQIWAYGIAVWAGLFGAIALLAKSRAAHPIFVVSLVAVVVLFGWEFVATDLIAAKGPLLAMGFPVFITVMAIVQILFADHARKRGWLR